MALGAVHYFYPGWIRSPEAWHCLATGCNPPLSPTAAVPGDVPDPMDLKQTIENHRERFKEEPFQDHYREKLIELYPELGPEPVTQDNPPPLSRNLVRKD